MLEFLSAICGRKGYGDYMIRACDLRQKEVINVCGAQRLGYIYDVDIDFDTGNIRSIIIPARRGIFSRLFKKRDYVIPWDKIVCVGEDIVLVQMQEFLENKSITS